MSRPGRARRCGTAFPGGGRGSGREGGWKEDQGEEAEGEKKGGEDNDNGYCTLRRSLQKPDKREEVRDGERRPPHYLQVVPTEARIMGRNGTLFHLALSPSLPQPTPYLQVVPSEASLPEAELVHLLVVVAERSVGALCAANWRRKGRPRT